MRKHGLEVMSEETYNKLLRFIQEVPELENIRLFFYGGEPLMFPDRLAQFCREAKDKFGKRISIGISTNGSLLDEKIRAWAYAENIILNVSFDVHDTLQNQYRKTQEGYGSYNIVHSNLLSLKQENPDFFESNVNILITYESIVSLAQIANSWIMDPVLSEKRPCLLSQVERVYESALEEVNEKKIIEQYYYILKLYLNNLKNPVWQVFFNQMLSPILNRPIYDIPTFDVSSCVSNLRKIFVDVRGNIHLCEKFGDNILGTLDKGVGLNTLNDFNRNYVGFRKRNCISCEVRKLCDVCLADDLNDKIRMKQFCLRQISIVKAQLTILCELAEKGIV
jgi:uncharacterized protein